jgi:hypothetical protein
MMVPVNAAAVVNGKRVLCGTIDVPATIRTRQLEALFRTRIWQEHRLRVDYFIMFYPGEVVKTPSGYTVAPEKESING